MAITDDQMNDLLRIARRLGRNDAALGVHCDPRDVPMLVLDTAASEGMRTEDEWDAEVTIEDLPAPEDRRDLIDAYGEGVRSADS